MPHGGSPKGLQFNASYGHSTNQEIVNASPEVGLEVDDQVFFRPMQSEFVLLQFGDLVRCVTEESSTIGRR